MSKSTKEVLIDMLTENTGRHMLDSGGAYGRNFEKNRKIDIESEPYLDIYDFDITDGHISFCAYINIFHFLYDRLDYEEEIDNMFYKFVDTLPEEMAWEECLEKFCEHYDYKVVEAVNTYNYESDLSQVMVFWILESETGNYPDVIVLRIHGGCDIRGGYTAPRFFTGNGNYGCTHEGGGLFMDRVEGLIITCKGDNPNIDNKTETFKGFPEKPQFHEWEIMSYSKDGSHYTGDGDGKPLEDLDVEIKEVDGITNIKCPYCESDTTIGVY